MSASLLPRLRDPLSRPPWSPPTDLDYDTLRPPDASAPCWVMPSAVTGSGVRPLGRGDGSGRLLGASGKGGGPSRESVSVLEVVPCGHCGRLALGHGRYHTWSRRGRGLVRTWPWWHRAAARQPRSCFAYGLHGTQADARPGVQGCWGWVSVRRQGVCLCSPVPSDPVLGTSFSRMLIFVHVGLEFGSCSAQVSFLSDGLIVSPRLWPAHCFLLETPSIFCATVRPLGPP